MPGRLAPMCILMCALLLPAAVWSRMAGAQTADPATPQVESQRSQPVQQRIPQQAVPRAGALQGIVMDQAGRPLAGVEVRLSGVAAPVFTSGDGIFRALRIPPGSYELVFTPRGGAAMRRPDVAIHAGEVLSIEVHLTVADKSTAFALPQTPGEVLGDANYKELTRRPDADGAVVAAPLENILPDAAYFQPKPDRWNASMPNYHRYNLGDETPFVLGHWYDPFNRNRLKADKPLFGKTFFSLTADSITALEGKRLPVAAGQSTANPDEPGFYGKGGQFFLAQTFRFGFDLFHGDTSAFRPVDWRIHVTPAVNLTYRLGRENQIFNPLVTNGTTHFDTHESLQEAFGEVKVLDLRPELRLFESPRWYSVVRVGLSRLRLRR